MRIKMKNEHDNNVRRTQSINRRAGWSMVYKLVDCKVLDYATVVKPSSDFDIHLTSAPDRVRFWVAYEAS